MPFSKIPKSLLSSATSRPLEVPSQMQAHPGSTAPAAPATTANHLGHNLRFLSIYFGRGVDRRTKVFYGYGGVHEGKDKG
jgi:hypothetical protein